jgi:hypothetical protein
MPPKEKEEETASQTGFEIALRHLIEMGKFPDRPSALHAAYHNARVRAYCNQMAGAVKRLVMKQQKETPTVEKLDADQWHVVAKADPNWFVSTIEKGVQPAGDPYSLTVTAAKAAHPDLSEARAFAKFVDAHPALQSYAFTPPDPFSYMQSEPLHKARPLDQGPQASLAPVFTGGANGDSRSPPSRSSRSPDHHSIGDVGTAAIDQLDRMTRDQLKLRNLSTKYYSRVFAELYTSPTNAALSEQERRENRPGGVERIAT